MRDIMDVLKALADENRLRTLGALKNGKLCVCQLIALLNLAPSTVSKHLTILRAARLVESRKDGRWMHYRLAREFKTPAAGKLLGLLFKDMEKTARSIEDRKRLKRICGENMEALCRRILGKP
ncbi:MAG: metalloregulator ArsR/SmtB family transcription factor [Kiritimatiellota bacterium]|nr:metalloregulator ArsR/SmtB family transcription factor [Kiritimatiellota bacterium]